MNIDFEMSYINVNFDNILIEDNNPIVNSESLYLQFKKQYFEQTYDNYDLFKRLTNELRDIEGNEGHSVSGNKYSYIFNDITKIESLRLTIKNIVISQEKLYNNFYQYITLLNSKREKFQKPSNPPVKRGVFSLFFDK